MKLIAHSSQNDVLLINYCYSTENTYCELISSNRHLSNTPLSGRIIEKNRKKEWKNSPFVCLKKHKIA